MSEPELDPACHLVRSVTSAIGYHTRFPAGVAVHDIRASLAWARQRLLQDDPAGRQTALVVLATVLDLQDTDPYSPTYGIWSWFAEEPLAQMAPPDWNWADFNGACLAEILARAPERVPDDLRTRTRAALGHAAWSIFRRNVRPDYTNIALMGAAVALCAGEILGEPRLIGYGRARLAAFAAHTAEHGGFNEYNSPTYTVVAIEELERIVRLVRDPVARAHGEALLRIAWEMVARHFHPGTAQWAGPNSRAYHDRLAAGTAALLRLKSGAPVPVHPRATGSATAPDWAVEGPACPADIAARFAALPQAEVEMIDSLLRRTDGSRRTGTTWMDADACLGSASDETFWTQTRPILGYWRTPADPAIVLRVRLLKDGKDFASGQVHCAQRGRRLLAAVGLVIGKGDWHPSLDRPADGVFQVADLRLRISLDGIGATAAAGTGGWVLAAGGHRTVIHPAGGCRGITDAAVTWEMGGDGGTAWLDARIPCPERLAPARDPWPRLAFALELLADATTPIAEEPAWSGEAVTWNGLSVTRPLPPTA